MTLSLIEVMKRLRDPQNGCPWDLAQSHESLMPYLLEETHEVRDALLQNGPDSEEFVEELGDLLFQVVFHAQLLAERRGIDFDHIAQKCADKLVRRHPHVFDPAHPGFDSPGAVNAQWEQLKGPKVSATTKLESIPHELPALQRAYRLGEKASSFGFRWPSSAEAWAKVEEELEELRSSTNHESREEELGDLFFALAQWARMEGIEPEWATAQANHKFTQRFAKLDALAESRGTSLKTLSLGQLLELWKEAKSVDS
ncbi:MAG TPA: nucleoside triphosphate pyrophosphohydrolase [Bdellovibrionota bacterium]|jgi:MazG family protein|nr:nucleoside triphosphate pyrophosphohydrolase [Bdellovibrionota bacterium]